MKRQCGLVLAIFVVVWLLAIMGWHWLPWREARIEGVRASTSSLGFLESALWGADSKKTLSIAPRITWTLREIANGVGMTLERFLSLNDLYGFNPDRELTRQDIGQISSLKVEPYSSFDVVLVTWYESGREMANGQPFNPEDETVVAHKWLPFGCRVRLTWLDTGQSIVVVVQDRGPYIGDRHFDLSRGAARKLGMKDAGKAWCRVEVLGP